MSTLAELLDLIQDRGYTRITVTGPQRSGTTIAAEILARDLGFECLREETINVGDLGRYFGLHAARDRFVIQAPGLCSFAHGLPGCVVLMRRPVDAILASQQRIRWTEIFEPIELRKYFTDQGPVAQVKYDAWERYQKPHMDHAYELDYESLRGHPLWIEAVQRRKFRARQTTLTAPAKRQR
jgi:hypothetical protein